MLPIIASNLLTNIHLMSNSLQHLADKAIRDFSVNEDVIAAALQKNPILVTALNPIIGYENAAQIAKRAYQQKRPVIEVALEMTELSKPELEKLLDPLTLTRGGLQS
jgi:fumarate hydratase class II